MSKKLIPIESATVYTNLYCSETNPLLHVWVTSGYFDNAVLVSEFYVPRKNEWVCRDTRSVINMFDVIKKRLRHEGYEFQNGHYTFSTGTYKQQSSNGR